MKYPFLEQLTFTSYLKIHYYNNNHKLLLSNVIAVINGGTINIYVPLTSISLFSTLYCNSRLLTTIKNY